MFAEHHDNLKSYGTVQYIHELYIWREHIIRNSQRYKKKLHKLKQL